MIPHIFNDLLCGRSNKGIIKAFEFGGMLLLLLSFIKEFSYISNKKYLDYASYL